MQKIKFSIITPTFNRIASGFLKENIDSVKNQKAGDFTYEHIIVNDGSSDETDTFLRDIGKKDKHIKYYYQDNAGVTAATRKGISVATGTHAIILDDDDMLTPDSLQLRADYITNNLDIDWFYGHADWIDDFGLPTTPNFRSKYYSDNLYERMLINNLVHAGTPTVKLKDLKAVKWPEWLKRSQDYFLWLELMRPERRLSVGFINQKLIKYRYHSQSYTSQIDNDVEKDEKKRQKEELNFQVKSLHPDSRYYLAKQAYVWMQEAHNGTKYWNEHTTFLSNQLKTAQDLINTYQSSRVIGRIIKAGNKYRKLRNKTRWFFTKLILKTKRVVKKILSFGSSPAPKVEVANKPWDGEKPLVSVVTPFYNRQDTMPETIRSVLNQTFQDFEYIVVDDGSPFLEAKSYLKKIKHPKILIIHQKNQGVAAARNNGIERSKGKYIVCLDSDDVLDPTYLEKAVSVLESSPKTSIVTFDTQMFGQKKEQFLYRDFDPLAMDRENLIITAAMFRREVWESTGGFKPEIGYEDWEFWVNAVKHGYFAKHIPETVFKYRTAHKSRFIEDQIKHLDHARKISELHPDFIRQVRKHIKKYADKDTYYDADNMLKNMSRPEQFILGRANKTNVLIAIPWMTFGGAETLTLNFTQQLKDKYNLSFVTGVKSSNEWEYKFSTISNSIYHLANLFENKDQYLKFISNYISTRDVDILHIVHSGYVFEMLPDIKKHNPKLKIAVTLFNDEVDYFEKAIKYQKYIEVFSTDNRKVLEHYQKELTKDKITKLIPNGIDIDKYDPANFDIYESRNELGILVNQYAVFYIGRLSEEKNPQIIVEVAEAINDQNLSDKFKFFIVGDGPMRNNIQKLIRDKKLKNIEYLGYQDDIPKVLSASDIFVLPSRVEGFPLSILEAMSMKNVVIASDVGAVSSIITDEENGFIVTPGSIDGIVEKLKLCLSNPGLAVKIKENAYSEVNEKYSQIQLGKEYDSMYKELNK